MIVDKACWERGCACYDDRVSGEGVEVVKKKWVGYTNEDRERIVPVLVQSLLNHDDKTMAVLLKAILIDIEQQLKEKNT